MLMTCFVLSSAKDKQGFHCALSCRPLALVEISCGKCLWDQSQKTQGIVNRFQQHFNAG